MAKSAPWHISHVVELYSIPLFDTACPVYSGAVTTTLWLTMWSSLFYKLNLSRTKKNSCPLAECNVACEVVPLRTFSPWTLVRVSNLLLGTLPAAVTDREIKLSVCVFHTPALLPLLALMHPAAESLRSPAVAALCLQTGATWVQKAWIILNK